MVVGRAAAAVREAGHAWAEATTFGPLSKTKAVLKPGTSVERVAASPPVSKVTVPGNRPETRVTSMEHAALPDAESELVDVELPKKRMRSG
jgi:hypothetical protein